MRKNSIERIQRRAIKENRLDDANLEDHLASV